MQDNISVFSSIKIGFSVQTLFPGNLVCANSTRMVSQLNYGEKGEGKNVTIS